MTYHPAPDKQNKMRADTSQTYLLQISAIDQAIAQLDKHHAATPAEHHRQRQTLLRRRATLQAAYDRQKRLLAEMV
jgi:hypothetical protein